MHVRLWGTTAAVIGLAAALVVPPAGAGPDVDGVPLSYDGDLVQIRAAGGHATGPTAATLDDGARSASWRDPRGDAPDARYDVRAASLRYDESAGRIRATVSLEQAPDAAHDAVLGMLVGEEDVLGGCEMRAVVAGRTHEAEALWAVYSDGSVSQSGTAKRSRTGSTLTMTAQAAALRGKNWDCGWALLQNSDQTETYDDTGYSVLSEVPRVVLFTDAPDHTSAEVGRWRTVEVTVCSHESGGARNVRVRAVGGKGVQVKPRRLDFGRVGYLCSAESKTKKLRVKLTRRAQRTVRFVATARGHDPSRAAMTLHPKAKPLPVRGASLAGTSFWGSPVREHYAWDNYGLTFVSKRFAYRGFAPAGIPACRKVTARGARGQGCVRYRYAPRSGALVVAGQKGTYRKGVLVLGNLRYRQTLVPRAGSRFPVSLTHQGYYGCKFGGGCRTWQYDLTLDGRGRFSSSHSFTYTQGTFPPNPARGHSRGFLDDGSGTYTVKKRGLLVLRYSDGRTKRTTIQVDTDGKRRPDPFDAGLVIGSTNYY
jgi:hypothetical protein